MAAAGMMIWLLLGVIAAVIARVKRRGPLWILLAVLLGPFALLALLPEGTTDPPASARARTDPELVAETVARVMTATRREQGWMAALFAVFILAAVVLMYIALRG
jgi:hypothetical protein